MAAADFSRSGRRVSRGSTSLPAIGFGFHNPLTGFESHEIVSRPTRPDLPSLKFAEGGGVTPEGDDTPVAPILENVRSSFGDRFARFKAAPPSRAKGSGDDSQAPLLDAWFASFADMPTQFAAMDYVRNPEEPSYREHFAGTTSDRGLVDDASRADLPWLAAVCQLHITAADGSEWKATGWLAGPHTVVTAGHSVFLPACGGWAREVLVEFGTWKRTVNSSGLRTVAGWKDHGRGDANYGALQLPEAVPESVATPLAFQSLPDSAYAELGVAVVGYCSDKPPGTLWMQLRSTQPPQPRRFLYDQPVYGGMSGSPGLSTAEPPSVVGIQHSGEFSAWTAVRITDAVVKNIRLWNNSEPTSSPGA
jgi:V8-like Glu-specific endopeptidase